MEPMTSRGKYRLLDSRHHMWRTASHSNFFFALIMDQQMVRSQRSACLIEQHHGRDDEWALNWASRFTFCLFYCFGGVFFSAWRGRRMVFNCKSDDFCLSSKCLGSSWKKIMISTETQFCFVFNILETLFFRLRYSYYRFLFVLLLCFCEDLYSNCR